MRYIPAETEFAVAASGDITEDVRAAVAAVAGDRGLRPHEVMLAIRNHGSANAEIGAAGTTNGQRAITIAAGEPLTYGPLYWPLRDASLYAYLAAGAALRIRVHVGVP